MTLPMLVSIAQPMGEVCRIGAFATEAGLLVGARHCCHTCTATMDCFCKGPAVRNHLKEYTTEPAPKCPRQSGIEVISHKGHLIERCNYQG